MRKLFYEIKKESIDHYPIWGLKQSLKKWTIGIAMFLYARQKENFLCFICWNTSGVSKNALIGLTFRNPCVKYES